jgi:ribonuclease HII
MAADNVVGVDEVGRGSLAGPLVAVAYYPKHKIEGVKDHKKLPKKKIISLGDALMASGIWAESWISAREIDDKGIDWANRKGLRSALMGLDWALGSLRGLRYIVDGSLNLGPCDGLSVRVEPRADERYYEVAAAGIVAKVFRDRWMREHKEATKYAWITNVGYGTKRHKERITLHGPCGEHRLTFLTIT